mgnify:CR=1 FL=1
MQSETVAAIGHPGERVSSGPPYIIWHNRQQRIMQITINQKPFEVPDGATVEYALTEFGAKPPFAVAVNLGFVHRQNYAEFKLQANDSLEIVQPVAGG